MIGHGLTDRLKQHGWFAVFVDLGVVIVGILIALQVGAWSQGREESRLEGTYLERLKEDLEIERRLMDAAERHAAARIEAAQLLDTIASNPAIQVQPASRVAWAIETASWRSFPQINAFVYHELQSSGRLALIRSEHLRRSLAEHYTALQHDARVGDDLASQHRFDAATAGLLDIGELAAIERSAGDYRRIEITPERASQLAQSFSRRAAAIAELPGLVQHHTFNLRVIEQMEARADSIIHDIDRLRPT